MELHVHDPLSTLITVALPMADPGSVENDMANIKNEIATAIEHPTQLIQVCDMQLMRYYYKAICPGTALLIEVHYKQNIWSAREFFKNPNESFMLDIFHRGIKLL